MNFLIIAIIFTISSTVFAGPGGTGGGEVRGVAHFKDQQTPIYAGIDNGGGTTSAYSETETGSGTTSRFIHQRTNGSSQFALLELQKYLPIAKMETTNGEIFTTETMPALYPISEVNFLVMENGEVLFADEILELIKNDHQNLISI